MHLAALGSGSKGNAFSIICGEDAILIDAGFSCRQLCDRMAAVGVPIQSLRAVLLTHEHDDHVKGIRVLCDTLNIPLYASSLTADRLRRLGKTPRNIIEFETGGAFDVAGFNVRAFSVQHDAVDPVGFVIRRGDVKIGAATDLGRVTALVKTHLSDCDALILESNYDDAMLMGSGRTLHLKRRIRGQFGHLDNADAAAALSELIGSRTRLVLYVHISSECNTYELAYETGRTALEALGRDDVHFQIVRQDSPLPLLRLDAAGSRK